MHDDMPKRENTHIGMYLSTGVCPAQEGLDSARTEIDIVLVREMETSTVLSGAYMYAFERIVVDLVA
jgi:hypothetical protein